jgi:hypothetical protein
MPILAFRNITRFLFVTTLKFVPPGTILLVPQRQATLYVFQNHWTMMVAFHLLLDGRTILFIRLVTLLATGDALIAYFNKRTGVLRNKILILYG